MGRRREKTTKEENQVRFDLNTEEEKKYYRRFRGLLVEHGYTLRDIFLPCMHETIEKLSKRTLPLNTTLRLSKKKGRVIQREGN